jgi:muconate cycloisomerase
MKITNIRTTPLFCRFKQPYHWAQGVNEGAAVVLIEVETNEGITGIGESVAGPCAEAVIAVLKAAAPTFIGQPIFDIARLMGGAYHLNFAMRGTGSAPRFAAQVFSGVELALWDALGKALNQPVHRLIGGAVHESIGYFGFVQGDTAEEVAAHARDLAAQGFSVLYLKIGRSDDVDVANTRAVRDAIADRRLRLDANEAWDMLQAERMIERLTPFGPEFIEQPVPSRCGASGLAALKANVAVPLAADQGVFTPEDVYTVCRSGAANVIVLGLHETSGILGFRKAAAVAETANLNICVHGVFETGLTTCAANQAAATIPNLDDGNQIMCQLLDEDIVEAPVLAPKDGRLPVFDGPGLGFVLNDDAVARAAEAYQAGRSRS